MSRIFFCFKSAAKGVPPFGGVWNAVPEGLRRRDDIFDPAGCLAGYCRKRQA